MKKWKWTAIGSAAVLLICLAGLLFTDVSLQFQPELLTLPGGEPGQVEYYPGKGETAFLLAANESGTAEKPLLSCLLQSGAPVLVVRPEIGDENEVRTLEAQAALLSQQTGLPESKLVLIGFHSGGTALLDELLNGGRSFGAMAVMSPVISSSRIDEGTIVNGNYRNESDWINSLSPEMVRQPTLLLSSNGDDRTTPYSMTLIYNKLSGDEIIHVGGVYQASRDAISLSILDGGFHSNSPYHFDILRGLFSFLNQRQGLSLSLGVLPYARNVMRFLLVPSLLCFLACLGRLFKYRLTDVSYGVPSSIKVENPVKFFLAKAAAWLLSVFAVWAAAYAIRSVSGNSISVSGLFTLILFSYSALGLAVGKGLKLPGIGFFRPVSVKPAKLAICLGLTALSTAVLLAFPFSGYTFTLPTSGWQFAAAVVLSYFWFRLFLVEQEQIKDFKSGLATKAGYYLVLAVPLLVFSLLYAIFGGNSAALACGVLFGLLAGEMVLGTVLFRLSGDAAFSALLASISFQTAASALASF